MLSAILLAATLAAAPPGETRPYDLAKTGIEWHEGLDAATGKGRPILLFQLLGRFDEVHC